MCDFEKVGASGLLGSVMEEKITLWSGTGGLNRSISRNFILFLVLWMVISISTGEIPILVIVIVRFL
jgi:hypothetical protein